MSYKFKTSLIFLIFILAVSSRPAAAQPHVNFGVRFGGFFSEPPVEAPSSHVFPPTFTDRKSPLSVGPAVDVQFFDRLDVRFEAVYKRFRYDERSSSFVPPTSSFTATTHGRSWEFPLLATYRLAGGPLRPFAGGGLSAGGITSGTREFQQAQSSGGTITFKSQETLYTPRAFYVTGGLSVRMPLFSLRPELRFGHWFGTSSSPVNIFHSPNSLEFVLGIFH